MKLSDFRYMNRQAAPEDVATRFLLNGMLVGPKEAPRLKKVKGSISRVAGKQNDDGENIEFEKIFMFKHPEHPFAQIETFFAIYAGNLYWWDQDVWHKVEIGSATHPDLPDPRIFVEKSNIHILGGPDGVSAQYRFINRDPGIGNGYFGNVDGFVGFWYGAEKVPTADKVFPNIVGYSMPCSAAKGFGLTTDRHHYMMAIAVDIFGQSAAPNRESHVKIMSDLEDIVAYPSMNAMMNIDIDIHNFDKRIVAVDIYGAVSTDSTKTIKKIFGEKREAVVPSGDMEFEQIDWRFLRRVDLNDDTVYYDATMKATAENKLEYYSNEKSVNWYGEGSIVGNFFIRYKHTQDQEWSYSRIMASEQNYEQFITTITVKDNVFVAGQGYIAQIVSSLKAIGSDEGSSGGISSGSVAATGYIKLLKHGVQWTDLKHKTITIGPSGDQTVFTEGHSWKRKGNSMFLDTKATLESIQYAINRSTYVDYADQGVYETQDEDYYTLRIIARDGGVSGNSILMSTTVASPILIVSANLSGGLSFGGTVATAGNAAPTLRIPVLWRLDGVEDESMNELGSPLDTLQPYSTLQEYFPEAKFATVQNRRTFRLCCKTDDVYENMVLWSEIDSPAVVPNGNVLILNSRSGEKAMGIGGSANRVIAIMESSLHVILMTGEPISYDGDDGVFQTSCVCADGVVWVGGVPFWLGEHGINAMEGSQIEDLTKDTLMDDYIGILQSEYENAGNSYDQISGVYDKRNEIIIWSFPNSMYRVEDIIINLIAFDIKKGGFFFLQVTTNGTTRVLFRDFFVGYNNKVYGVSDSAIYELFSDDSVEPNSIYWRSGIVTSGSDGELMVEKISMTYNGTVAVEVFKNRYARASYNRGFPRKTSLGKHVDDAMVVGDELQLMIATGAYAEEMEVAAFEAEIKKIPSL